MDCPQEGPAHRGSWCGPRREDCRAAPRRGSSVAAHVRRSAEFSVLILLNVRLARIANPFCSGSNIHWGNRAHEVPSSHCMKAAVSPRYGPPEILTVADVPTPVPGDREVLVHIHASTVCYGDWIIRKGLPLRVRQVDGARKTATRAVEKLWGKTVGTPSNFSRVFPCCFVCKNSHKWLCINRIALFFNNLKNRPDLPWAQGVGRSNRPAPTNQIKLMREASVASGCHVRTDVHMEAASVIRGPPMHGFCGD
jgi:hypothetical protein